MTLPPPNTTSSPPAQRSSVDLDPQVGVGEADAVAGRRSVQRPVAGAVDEAHRSVTVPRPIERAADVAAQAGDTRSPTNGTRSTSVAMPGSNRTDVPAGMSSR